MSSSRAILTPTLCLPHISSQVLRPLPGFLVVPNIDYGKLFLNILRVILLIRGEEEGRDGIVC